MKQIYISKKLLLILVIFTSAFLYAGDDAGNLNSEYKAAMAKKEFDHATAYICQAAKLDPHKYGKKCDSMQRYTADQLVQYESIFNTSKFELDHKDYAGAIRDLKKIYFGPRHEEAQRIIQEASKSLNLGPQPANTDGRTLAAAQAAYENGNFAAALELASSIKEADLLAGTREIVTNIRIYNQSIQEGDAYMQSGNLAAAKQKYSFALAIKNNGPGNPGDKLLRISSMLASTDSSKPQVAESKDKTEAKAPSNPVAQVERNKAKSAANVALDSSKKVKELMAKAHESETSGDAKAAVSTYEQVLAIDPQQEDAVLARQRLLDAMQADPQEVEDTLIKGVRSYGQSHFEEARDAITLYLKEGGVLKGPAYFYLGATFMSEAFLSDAQNKNRYDDLQKNAIQNFHLAKQAHFKPLEKYVSPKIMAVWNRSDLSEVASPKD
ncbi:hypothetical protein [Granulicella sp. dw_53]|uniref:hypothetical protein n=1 Tax=Granulicella sp. dw_53 TaxID=2719792 RepID=UPI001BD246EE|nr:hypothetical protein [Granulicella sp. dw_53]